MPELEPLIAYGVTFPEESNLRPIFGNVLLRELLFFKIANDLEAGTARVNGNVLTGYNGPGCYQHARNCAEMLWRRKGHEVFEWHDDLETALQEYCATGKIAETLITGPASGGKTFGAAIYALLFVLCDPKNSGVLGCSTTLDGLKKRFWGDVRMLFQAAKWATGGMNLVDSKTCIQTEQGDMKHGIFGIAVAEGNESKALGRIIGFHPKRLLVIVDELTDVGWAIIEALTNLFTAKEKAIFIGIGNAASIFDSHGKMCEPKEGWNSINVNSTRWETVRGGICIHFDAFKNPNVRAGRTLFKFLATQEDIDRTAKQYGENSPQMWRMRRGFWCPEGTVKSVLSESIIKNFLTMEKATWEGSKTKVAGLDPAFEGGDRCILRFALVGKSSKGIDTLELGRIVTIKTDMTKAKTRPTEYQIADRVKEECQAEGVEIANFAMDTTGAGAGLAAVISEEWGYGFHKVQFAERPSDLPCGLSDPTPCNEAYKNKVTELWYSFRNAVMSYQIKGLDAETAVEFCSRLYTSEGKTWVESKSDMKARPGARSPDLADAAVVILDLVKHKGFLGTVVTKMRQTVDRAWEKLVQEFALEESDYQQDSVAAI